MDYISKLQTYAKRNREVVRCRAGGMSYGKIAKRFGISRARAHQITKRAEQ